MNGIENHKKTNIFFIVERLYPRDSLAPSVGTVGPSLVQVHRMIYQLTKKQDVFLDGEKVDLSNITLWQRLKSITGGKITTKDSQELSSLMFWIMPGVSLLLFLFKVLDLKVILITSTKNSPKNIKSRRLNFYTMVQTR